MKRYFVLYKAPVGEFQKMMKNSKPEDMKKEMDEWRKWMDAHKKDLVDPGMPVGKTKRVDPSGVSNIRNDIGGYSIVQANSHDEAAKLFDGHAHLQIPRATIEVMEIVPMSA